MHRSRGWKRKGRTCHSPQCDRRTAMWIVALVLAALLLLLSLILASVLLVGQTLCASRNTTAELDLPEGSPRQPAIPSNPQHPWPAWAATH
uniref:Uncharacterized protein n=2 Tax=Ectopseudomonas TaxID=3236654 RepID=A4XND9_ECTM1